MIFKGWYSVNSSGRMNIFSQHSQRTNREARNIGGNISLRLSTNSEAFASKFVEKLEEMILSLTLSHAVFQ